MIAINKLYGVLLGAAVITDAYQWYAKKYTTCATTDKINQILEVPFGPRSQASLQRA